MNKDQFDSIQGQDDAEKERLTDIEVGIYNVDEWRLSRTKDPDGNCKIVGIECGEYDKERAEALKQQIHNEHEIVKRLEEFTASVSDDHSIVCNGHLCELHQALLLFLLQSILEAKKE